MKLSLAFICFSLFSFAYAKPQLLWQDDSIPFNRRSLAAGGNPVRFNQTGTTCQITDFNNTVDSFPNLHSVCRLAAKYISSTCSINGTTNTYVCSGEVNPASSCTITDSKQVTCN